MPSKLFSRHLRIDHAADDLAVTPSAVTHLVRRLESDLGVSLLRKNGRHIELTEAGKRMAPELQAVFTRLGHIVTATRSQSQSYLLTISLRPYFALKWLAPRLGRFWHKHPEIELRLHHRNDATAFENSEIDLAVEWNSGQRKGLKSTLLVPGELTPVLSPRLLETLPRVVEPSDLRELTLLRETDHDSWNDWFKLARVGEIGNVRSIYIDDSNVRSHAAINAQGVEPRLHGVSSGRA